LVVAALPQPPAMQRHGNNQIGVIQQRAAGSLEPAGKSRCVIQPVAIFECEDQRLGRFVAALGSKHT
jgi:hypothetical protein